MPHEADQLGQRLLTAAAHHERKLQLILDPSAGIEQDYKRIYVDGDLKVGWTEGLGKIYEHFTRDNTYLILGAALGDEGKGSVVDRIISGMSQKKDIKKIYVTRFQGGGNAGHTVVSGDKKVASHHIPSIAFQPELVELLGFMDSMMTVHPEELMLEYNHIEDVIGSDSMKGRLILSRDAILNTDLDRAEEQLLDLREGTKPRTTGKGIRTSVSHHYDTTGLKIKDLLANEWRDALGKKYDQMADQFQILDLDFAQVKVTDFKQSLEGIKKPEHEIGTKDQYLDRLAQARDWLIQKDMVQNTFPLHIQALKELLAGTAGHIFEGAQAIGLNPWLGTLKDVTSTDTSASGVLASTKLWQAHDMKDRIGVFKATYMSSVGTRHSLHK